MIVVEEIENTWFEIVSARTPIIIIIAENKYN